MKSCLLIVYKLLSLRPLQFMDPGGGGIVEEHWRLQNIQMQGGIITQPTYGRI